MDADLIEAIDNMLKDRPVVRLNERLQSAIDAPTMDAITAVAAHLAEEGNPQELRSQAVRYMLRKGAEAIRREAKRRVLAEEAVTA